MKIKTSELTGAALDWAVGTIDQPDWEPEDLMVNLYLDDDGYYYSPSTNWMQGGPIIEGEGIATDLDGDIWCASYNTKPIAIYGPTPLTAAMRCYVTSKLGDEVEIPEELLK